MLYYIYRYIFLHICCLTPKVNVSNVFHMYG